MKRDNRKNQDYFKTYLQYQSSRINKKIKKLSGIDDDKKQRILMSLTGYEVDLLKAEFSAGLTKEPLRLLLCKAIAIIKGYKKITYEDLLVLLSLCVILDNKKDALDLINENKQTIETDRLLKYIASYARKDKSIWEKKLPLSKEYSLLDEVFESKINREDAMLLYLNNWYENHAEHAWYDSHLRDTDTYCGYWSFEAAAIAKILRLNEDKLKNSVYYPVL